MNKTYQHIGACLAAAGLLTIGTGCEQLPGSPSAQGAAIGGVSGAAAGAVIAGSDNRVLGAIIGGALGAGGGYIIGANKDKILGKDKASAEQAQKGATSKPATSQDAVNAATADLNQDGFVTMDEVVAMDGAGLSNEEMLEKLKATGQVFELTPEQVSYLETQGVDSAVVKQMPELNREIKDSLVTSGSTR